ncbi:MAG: [Fe-Fe] hydrogenase large subunit C-terminal domain-containing protein [Oscillospiraceae bacterium]|nr:[Fe-Fe] hydrogenase large subunit C-terminal domain-containing protein [Oscillospiraceae bacterium]
MSDYIRLNEASCKNCYKCIRHCPTKSISFSENQARIISDECILCGQCFIVCPQNAKVVRDDTDKVRVLLSGGAPVIVSLAPSFAAAFPGVGIGGMEQALKRLGFFAAEETAFGATIVKKQYEELIGNGGQDVVISSCCPSVNLLIQKHFPAALPFLAKVVSPMLAHCRDIKQRYPEAKTVFIGPCISKKYEADEFPHDVDCAMTFDELTNWFRSEGIEPLPEPYDPAEKGRARIFPTAGGILKSMDCVSEVYSYFSVDGLENCVSTLSGISEGNISKCFVEMSACQGSCIGGPVMSRAHHAPLQDYIAVEKFAGRKDFSISAPDEDSISRSFESLVSPLTYPNEIQLREILLKMGKNTSEDELNCGSCGYNSCREKAIAVFQGKADLSMCTPFLKEKAETFSSNILRNSPNGIIVLNGSLEVQQINPAALKILNIRNASDVVGANVVCILEPAAFSEVLRTGRPLRDNRIYLAEYKKYIEQTIVLDKVYRMLLCILRDVTDEETERQKKEEISLKTIEITDKVIEKQMRVGQEIASLLGETTAETKVALTKLKESLEDE